MTNIMLQYLSSRILVNTFGGCKKNTRFSYRNLYLDNDNLNWCTPKRNVRWVFCQVKIVLRRHELVLLYTARTSAQFDGHDGVALVFINHHRRRHLFAQNMIIWVTVNSPNMACSFLLRISCFEQINYAFFSLHENMSFIAGARCAAGDLSMNSKCYRKFDSQLTWYSASNDCLLRGGSLAVFTDIRRPFDNSRLTDWLTTSGTNNTYWIGLIRSWWKSTSEGNIWVALVNVLNTFSLYVSDLRCCYMTFIRFYSQQWH